MPKELMVVYTDPSHPSREEEFRDWYDQHIADALRLAPGIRRARRYRLSTAQRHSIAAPGQYMTIYEIEADDLAAVHDRLVQASQTGELAGGEVARLGPVTYWDLDVEITRDGSSRPGEASGATASGGASDEP